MRNKDDASWYAMLDEAKLYVSEYGDLEVPTLYVTKSGKKLGIWIKNQRKLCDPESERGKLLSKLGMRFETRQRSKMTWEEMYEYAKAYFDKYGDLEVPATFIVEDEKNGKINLGTWIHRHRKDCDPESEHGKLLSKIGMRFDSRMRILLSWEEMYEYAKSYFDEYGDLDVPYKYKIENEKNERVNLGVWISTQRKNCDPESEYGKLLSKIGMRFDNKYLTWEEMYEKAKTYFDEHGDLEIPAAFKIEDEKYGIINLGMWLAKQRERCNPESDRGVLLSKIGMRFETKKKNKVSWEEMYEKAKAYLKEYGNLDVPYNFKTIDGILFDKSGSNLGAWIYYQKTKCDPESEHGKLLSSIGIKFEDEESKKNKESTTVKWLKMYLCAVTYYKNHGNLNVPRSFKDSDGLALGIWLVRQRYYYGKNKLSADKVSMLDSIGMIWEKRKNRFDISVMCDEYNIDINKNNLILKHISFADFKVKIDFIKSLKAKGYNISIVDENGMLHEIFSMSSINMKFSVYGESFEKFVEEYNKGKSK